MPENQRWHYNTTDMVFLKLGIGNLGYQPSVWADFRSLALATTGRAMRFRLLNVAFVVIIGLLPTSAAAAQATDYERDPAVIRDFQQGRELRRAGSRS